MNVSGSDRMPRGAVVVVLAGLLLTALVAWVSDETLVASNPLAWAEHHPRAIPAAGPEDLDSGGAALLASTGIDVTDPNSGGDRLFQVGTQLRISLAEAPVATRVECVQNTEVPTVNARTPDRPAAFPGAIDDLALADWPAEVDINHRDQGSPFSTVTLPDAYEDYGTVDGVSVDWGDWESGQQLWTWDVPADLASEPVMLRAVSLWRTVRDPAIEVTCSVERGAERAVLATGGGLGG